RQFQTLLKRLPFHVSEIRLMYLKLFQSSPSKEKIVIQLARKKSECLLSFACEIPAYMSPNVFEGKRECKIFFPEGYDEPPEPESEEDEEEDEGKEVKEEEEVEAVEEGEGEVVEGVEASDDFNETMEESMEVEQHEEPPQGEEDSLVV
ncbi:hypothetical protein HHI36_006572, partial [Cryptolaemus montrouzieri]